MFYETSSGKVSHFAFSELEEIAGFAHAFSSRRTDSEIEDASLAPEVAERKPTFLDALGVPAGRVITLRQVHSDRVLDSQEAADSVLTAKHRKAGDGILLNRLGWWGVIRAADCVPLLLVAPKQRQACLVHAGWRGSCNRIVRSGALQLLDSSGACPCEIVAAAGPSIRACCYQVGHEVRDSFEAAGHDLQRLFRGDRLDLIEAVRADLESVGVNRLIDSGICTACRSDLFYSWRKRQDSGRLWVLAGFRQ